MVTDIGATDADNYIIDEDSTYRWYLKGAVIDFLEDDNVNIVGVGAGTVQAEVSSYRYSIIANISYTFTSFTHFSNWKKARGYWRVNGKLLTLHVESTLFGDNNIALYSDYATPTTLVDLTGVIRRVQYSRSPGPIEVKAVFVHCTDVV